MRAPTEIRQERPAPIQPGQIIMIGMRPVMVVRLHGTDDAAPVIVEEMISFGASLPGQLALFPLRAFTDPLFGRGRR